MHIRIFITYLIALIGALAFLVVDLPLPWLFGPMFACLMAALFGFKLSANKTLGDAMRTILGVAVGATVSVAFLQSLPSIAPTLALVPLLTIGLGVCGVYYFKALRGYDFATAYYASMPGGLQDMLVFGEAAGANLRALSLIHATRVLVIVVLLPIILTGVWQVDLTQIPGEKLREFAPNQVFILLFCALLGWQVAKYLGMFGASILGPLIFAAIASLIGILHTRPPRRGDLGGTIFYRHWYWGEICWHHPIGIKARYSGWAGLLLDYVAVDQRCNCTGALPWVGTTD